MTQLHPTGWPDVLEIIILAPGPCNLLKRDENYSSSMPGLGAACLLGNRGALPSAEGISQDNKFLSDPV